MNRFVKVVFLLSFSVVMLIGCDLAGNSGDDAYVATAPDMGSPNQLAAAGAAPPATATESKALFIDTLESFSTGFETMLGDSSARNITTVTETINESLDYSDDSLTVTGGVSGTYKYVDTDDPDFDPQPNTTYNNVEVLDLSLELNATITALSFIDTDDNNYILNGKVKENGRYYMDVDVVTDETGNQASMDIDLSISDGMGMAFSIKRTDLSGATVGGKFILSYAVNIAKDNFDPTTENPFDDTAFADQKGTLRVYNDDNELVHSVDISFSELMDLSTFSTY